MDKRRLRAALKVLEIVETKYAETKDLIDEKCQKEKISVEEVTFFYKSRSKELAQKNVLLFCSEYVKKHFIKLNSLGYNIYLRVI